MNAYTSVQSYNSIGGHPTISLLGQFIEEYLSSLDHGIAAFESEACLRTNRPPRRTLEDSYEKFHNSLARLPSSRWETKKSRLVVRYESHLGLAEELLKNRSVSSDLLARALEELIEVLGSLQPKLAKKKGLDIGVFLTGLESLRPHVAQTETELSAFGDQQFARKRAEISKLPWDQQLEIDWDQFHPDAKALLDDPFFWSQSHDYSPHGNDTGADLLAAFMSWNRKYPDAGSDLFLDNLIQKWGMDESVRQARVKQPEHYNQDEEIALVVLQEAVVALAFAEIKLRGSCTADLASEARIHLERQLDPTLLSALGWSEPSQVKIDSNTRLLAVLENFLPEDPKPWWRFW